MSTTISVTTISTKSHFLLFFITSLLFFYFLLSFSSCSSSSTTFITTNNLNKNNLNKNLKRKFLKNIIDNDCEIIFDSKKYNLNLINLNYYLRITNKDNLTDEHYYFKICKDKVNNPNPKLCNNETSGVNENNSQGFYISSTNVCYQLSEHTLESIDLIYNDKDNDDDNNDDDDYDDYKLKAVNKPENFKASAKAENFKPENFKASSTGVKAENVKAEEESVVVNNKNDNDDKDDDDKEEEIGIYYKYKKYLGKDGIYRNILINLYCDAYVDTITPNFKLKINQLQNNEIEYIFTTRTKYACGMNDNNKKCNAKSFKIGQEWKVVKEFKNLDRIETFTFKMLTLNDKEDDNGNNYGTVAIDRKIESILAGKNLPNCTVDQFIFKTVGKFTYDNNHEVFSYFINSCEEKAKNLDNNNCGFGKCGDYNILNGLQRESPLYFSNDCKSFNISTPVHNFIFKLVSDDGGNGAVVGVVVTIVILIILILVFTGVLGLIAYIQKRKRMYNSLI
ncbi:hypothetical protein ABK040_002697 [Willaertia magna]